MSNDNTPISLIHEQNRYILRSFLVEVYIVLEAIVTEEQQGLIRTDISLNTSQSPKAVICIVVLLQRTNIFGPKTISICRRLLLNDFEARNKILQYGRSRQWQSQCVPFRLTTDGEIFC